MTEEGDFLAALGSAPRDDAVRLAFADWLEERGDQRAHFLRIDCQLARCPPEDPHAIELRRRLAEQFAGLDTDWVATVCHGLIAGCCNASRWCPLTTWERLQPLPPTDVSDGLRRRFRRCPNCAAEVGFVTQVEAVRKILHHRFIAIAVDPRIVLSAEALLPTPEDHAEYARYIEADLRAPGHEGDCGWVREGPPPGKPEPADDTEPDGDAAPF